MEKPPPRIQREPFAHLSATQGLDQAPLQDRAGDRFRLDCLVLVYPGALETQAAFLARQQLANLHAGVPISIWYDWKNDGADPAEREHNFGTVTHDLKPKPACVAVQTLTRELSGFRIENRLATGSTNDWVLLLSRGAERKLAAWSAGDSHPATIAGLDFRSATAVHGNGDPAPVRLEQGSLSLSLTALPQYVTLRN